MSFRKNISLGHIRNLCDRIGVFYLSISRNLDAQTNILRASSTDTGGILKERKQKGKTGEGHPHRREVFEAAQNRERTKTRRIIGRPV